MFSTETNATPSTSLYWLIRLRWIAAGTLFLIAGIALFVFELQLPLGIVAATLLLLLSSNAAVRITPPGSPSSAYRYMAAMILVDVLLLTGLLYFTGGAHNPFTVLYVLHITLAVMLLNVVWACFFVFLCSLSFALLFTSNYMLIGSDGVAVCNDLDFHLQGMLAATVVTGAGVIYFVAHLNRSLRASRVTAERAQKIAEQERHFSSLVTVAAGVSHELATPLATIAVASRELEIALDNSQSDPTLAEDIRLIRSEVERCSLILSKLSSTALHSSNAPEQRVQAQKIPEELQAFLATDCYRRLDWNIDPAAKSLELPAQLLLRVLTILIKNACEASAPSAVVKVHLEANQAFCSIQVIDQGHGMTEEQLKRLGDPFYTTKPQGQGIGLGYFLAKNMIERAGGNISVQSILNQGTSITLTLPLHSEC